MRSLVRQHKQDIASRGLTVALFVLIAGMLISGGMVAAEEMADDGETPIEIETEEVSINLHTDQTSIDHDETVVFIHSVTNHITNEAKLTVQLILEVPSGVSVSGAAGTDQGSGSQYSTSTTLEPGEQESLRIHVEPHEPGEYEAVGEVVYFFGEDRSSGTTREAAITLEQKPEPTPLSQDIAETAFENNLPLILFIITIFVFISGVVISRVSPNETQSVVVVAVSVVLIIGLLIAGIGVLGISFDDATTVEESAPQTDQGTSESTSSEGEKDSPITETGREISFEDIPECVREDISRAADEQDRDPETFTFVDRSGSLDVYDGTEVLVEYENYTEICDTTSGETDPLNYERDDLPYKDIFEALLSQDDEDLVKLDDFTVNAYNDRSRSVSRTVNDASIVVEGASAKEYLQASDTERDDITVYLQIGDQNERVMIRGGEVQATAEFEEFLVGLKYLGEFKDEFELWVEDIEESFN